MSQLNRIVVLGAIWVSLGYADAGIVSLRPLYTPETAVLNPALVDLWTDKGITFRIEADGDTGYQVVVDREQVATIHLVQLGGETIADLVFIQQQSFFPQLSIHYFARLRVEGNTLHVDGLGGEKLVKRIERTGSPRYERLPMESHGEDYMVLTASTAELRQFVLDFLKLPEDFADSSTYERAGPKERAADLNERRWAVVSGRSSPEEYAKGLERAQEAVRLVPSDPEYWSTLGAAQYRSGAFNESLGALARAEQLRNAASIEDLIFRAMSHQQLGQKEKAQTVLLGELSKMLGDPRYLGDLQRYCGDQDKRSLLLEAEKLVVPKGK
ncbi:MAG: hypothetical protein NTW28_19660 [Candidatus Solibacter sp.]|nr:hypothetical protein [Candidatus Solibacter sp.]